MLRNIAQLVLLITLRFGIWRNELQAVLCLFSAIDINDNGNEHCGCTYPFPDF